MKILITGAKGMVGRSLSNRLKTLQDGRDKTRPNLDITQIFEYDLESTEVDLRTYCQEADFVFHLAGVNRPKDEAEFMAGNFGFSSTLIACLREAGNRSPIMVSSSIQASLEGRYADSDYGRSKLAGENLFLDYGKQEGIPVYVYRFPNLMGHSRPNYNSAVSTFCHAVANDLPFTVNDRSTTLELMYIDDLIEGLLDLLEGHPRRCHFEGVVPIEANSGDYCFIPGSHQVTLGEVVDLLEEFRQQPQTLLMPKIPENSFAKKLFSLYLTYLPIEKFKYNFKMNSDERGSFTELLHTQDCGQVSINISKPGITKGQHWHASKWEQFIVVSGRGLIQQRNIVTGQMVEFEVSGDNIEAVYMIPGWTHNIINLSETENLVTVMTCNEIFDSEKPDTYFEEVIRST